MSKLRRLVVPKYYTVASFEQEERFLNNMARRGWHLEHIVAFFYCFRRGQCSDTVYQLDFTHKLETDSDYRQMYADAGWELVWENEKITWFRTDAAKSKNTEIYTDSHTRIAALERLGKYTLTMMLLPVLRLLLSAYEQYASNAAVPTSVFVMIGLLFLLMGYVNVKIYWKMARIKKSMR